MGPWACGVALEGGGGGSELAGGGGGALVFGGDVVDGRGLGSCVLVGAGVADDGAGGAGAWLVAWGCWTTPPLPLPEPEALPPPEMGP